MVLSNALYFDASKRESVKAGPQIDFVEPRKDGSHLKELWNRRRNFYPENRTDLTESYVIDALKAGEKIEEGHKACHEYRMEDKVGKINCPTLLVCGTDDPYALPDQEKLKAKIKGSRLILIPGGMVPLPDQMPEEFSLAILPFLSSSI